MIWKTVVRSWSPG